MLRFLRQRILSTAPRSSDFLRLSCRKSSASRLRASRVVCPNNGSQGRKFSSTSSSNSYSLADKREGEAPGTLLSRDDKNDRPPTQPPTVTTLQRLFSFAQPEHSLIASSAATLLITSSTTLVLPAASGQVIDMVLGGDPTLSPPVVAAGLFSLTAMAGAGVYARTLWLQQAGNQLVARLKENLFRATLHQDMAYLEQYKTGDLLTRLSQDTQLIQSAVTTQAVAALRGVVMTAGSTALLLHTSPTLAAVSVATLPPLFLGARIVGQKLREQQRHVQHLHGLATGKAEQALQGIATVVQFGAQPQELQRYSEAVQKAHNKAIETGRIQALFEGAVHVAANGALLGVLGYGGSMVVAGTLSVGELTGFLMYSLLLAGNVSGLSGTYAEVSKAVAAADRVWELIDRKPAIPVGGDVLKDAPTFTALDHSMSIEFQNVGFSYPTRPEKVVLGPEFSLKVRPGEVLAIVGESGSGKSTLARLLTRLYDIDQHTGHTTDESAILINGKDIRDWDPQELRQRVIGIVSQEPWLLDGSLAENIRYGKPSATDQEVREAAALAHVWSFASGFPQGLETPVGPRGGTQLSGGQKQRGTC